ncbi:hypothetical protein LPB140_00565 [Sphingorhabdus lutea]|uniref:Uncharacterized protein n=1 Tax=Sphingorhabdus lutea TaxID=1913578 RepID=A0A1L3J8W9_9SPHN|nr:hypothetical protein [Sphingorhabdus lutea]APG61582.1 hypothetical protein LPB140_00565 [Sphingorhabdus lutea]
MGVIEVIQITDYPIWRKENFFNDTIVCFISLNDKAEPFDEIFGREICRFDFNNNLVWMISIKDDNLRELFKNNNCDKNVEWDYFAGFRIENDEIIARSFGGGIFKVNPQTGEAVFQRWTKS